MAPDFLDPRGVSKGLGECGLHLGPTICSILKQALGFDSANGFKSSPHRQGVTAESGAVIARLENSRSDAMGNNSTDGNPRP